MTSKSPKTFGPIGQQKLYMRDFIFMTFSFYRCSKKVGRTNHLCNCKWTQDDEQHICNDNDNNVGTETTSKEKLITKKENAITNTTATTNVTSSDHLWSANVTIKDNDNDQQPATTKNTNTNPNTCRKWVILGLQKKTLLTRQLDCRLVSWIEFTTSLPSLLQKWVCF